MSWLQVSESHPAPEAAPAKICFCRECGAALPPDALFCRHCGTKIVDTEQQIPTAGQQPSIETAATAETWSNNLPPIPPVTVKYYHAEPNPSLFRQKPLLFLGGGLLLCLVLVIGILIGRSSGDVSPLPVTAQEPLTQEDMPEENAPAPKDDTTQNPNENTETTPDTENAPDAKDIISQVAKEVQKQDETPPTANESSSGSGKSSSSSSSNKSSSKSNSSKSSTNTAKAPAITVTVSHTNINLKVGEEITVIGTHNVPWIRLYLQGNGDEVGEIRGVFSWAHKDFEYTTEFYITAREPGQNIFYLYAIDENQVVYASEKVTITVTE